VGNKNLPDQGEGRSAKKKAASVLPLPPSGRYPLPAVFRPPSHHAFHGSL